MARFIPLALCLLLAPALHATVLLPAEFREIVSGSDIIAHARVVDVRAEWAEGRRRIDSVVTVEVLSQFKGPSDRRVSFSVPGGQIGRYRSVMVGAPAFRIGEEAVLFLSSAGDPLPHVFGLNQGVFRIRQDRASGRRIVIPPALLGTGTAPSRIRRGAPARRPVALELFGAQVRAVLAEQRGGAR